MGGGMGDGGWGGGGGKGGGGEACGIGGGRRLVEVGGGGGVGGHPGWVSLLCNYQEGAVEVFVITKMCVGTVVCVFWVLGFLILSIEL